MKILLKSALILDPGSKYHQKKVDLLISDGIIEKIGNNLKISDADKEIRLKDLHISKGWFDSSVSFGEPGFEERETLKNGLKTAARSGFTAVALNPDTQPVVDTNAIVSSLFSKSESEATELFPIGALTVRSQGEDLAELYDMKQAGAVAFGDYKKPVSNPNLLKMALLYTQNFGGLVQSFPQDRKIAGNGLVN
ncbi:MAG: dihydroorotase, partial [Gillisia sp.]